MNRAISLGFMLLACLSSTLAQQPAPPRLRMGINLSAPVDWSAEYPLVNVMKYCRAWLTGNSVWVGGGRNDWDTGYLDQIPLDADGYPLEMPARIAGAETTQVVHTIWTNTMAWPEGVYVLLYEGEGDVQIQDDGQIINRQPGRIEIRFTHQHGQMRLRLMRSVKGNHVRNLRLLFPGTETTYASQPFEPHWLEKIAPFKALRFMDWGHTNAETIAAISRWEQRAHRNDFTYTRLGMPYEVMIEAANTLHADAWVCIPHRANDDYLRQMARLFRDSLDADLKIYVEYSNEWWNWIFPVAHYVHDSLDQNLPWPERLAPKLQSVMNIWKEEFAGQENRLVRVFASQHYWPDLTWRVLAQLPPNTVDAVSPAAYVGLNGDSLNHYGAALTTDDVFRLANREFHDAAYSNWREYQKIAAQYQLDLIYYEGGQHFTPSPFGSDQPYNNTLVAAQTDGRIYDLYLALFDTLNARGNNPLLMYFTSISSTSGKYGSWGALANQFETHANYLDVAPKYQALLDYIKKTSTAITGSNPPLPAEFGLLQNYPNPFNPSTVISFQLSVSSHVTLKVFDVNGREVATLVEDEMAAGKHAVTFASGDLAGGLYFYQLIAGVFTQTRKAILMR